VQPVTLVQRARKEKLDLQVLKEFKDQQARLVRLVRQAQQVRLVRLVLRLPCQVRLDPLERKVLVYQFLVLIQMKQLLLLQTQLNRTSLVVFGHLGVVVKVINYMT
jgi:hypothetical protein